MKKRRTPDDDFMRLAEKVRNEYGDDISDEETFNYYFDEYTADFNNNVQSERNRKKVFNNYVELYGISRGRKVKPRREPERERELKMRVRRATRFSVVGKQRGKVVYARRITITRLGKPAVRFIDKRGRYVSARKE